jgi:glutathione S-transferase
MKLIETRSAPNPRRVRIFMAEKGVLIETEQRELSSLTSAEFTALNPEQRVPVLVLDGGEVIAETVAICRYIEELHPTPSLMGATSLERAQVEMWQRRVELGLFWAVAQVFRHLHPSMATMEVPQVAAWGEANKAKAHVALTKLDERLAHSRFIAGEAYSIADITALVAIDFMKPARIVRPVELVNLERWYQEVSARPSTKA